MLNVNFLTVTNKNNGYGMTREHLLEYLPHEGIILDTEFKNQDITLILHIPPAIQHAKGKVKVLYTMLEGDEVPDSWKPHLSMADRIIVPSTFVQETFAKSGFHADVIPLGYDPKTFKFVSRKEKIPYTFLHYEAFQDRKGWQEVLDAWLLSGLAEDEFSSQLILKTIKSYKEVYEILQSSPEIPLGYNVKIICGELPHHALFDLLSEVDCFIFPSRGEGFSMPPLEAMATGLPVILTQGHSHKDYYDEKYMYGVKSDIVIPARYSNWEDQGNFVRCSVDELAFVIKYVSINREEARKKGKLSARYAKKYSFENTAKALADYLWQMSGAQTQ